jgi:sirohydrochlorin cobaltochelatase
LRDQIRITSVSPLVKIPEDEAIVLMGHGSRDKKGAAEFLAFAQRLSARLGCPVYPGFLELADPPLATAIDDAIKGGARTIIALPWLLLSAGHAKNDMPVALDWARQRHPEVTIRYGAPIELQAEILDVLGDRLAAIDPQHGQGSPDTAVLLIQRGSSDPQANADVYRVARFLWEGRNFCTVEVGFSGVTHPSVEEGIERCLKYNVRHVLVVPYYLYTGILVERISTVVAKFAVDHPEIEFQVAEHLGLDPRLEALAQRMIQQTQGGKAAMNCDLCQYRVALFGRQERIGMPQMSDQSHGLRGMETSHDEHSHSHDQHTHDQHQPDQHTHGEHSHSHADDHDHGSTHEHHHHQPSDPLEELRQSVVNAGIMTPVEIASALQDWYRKRKAWSNLPPPYLLTALPGQPATAALRWDWQEQNVQEFSAWSQHVLLERFGVALQISAEEEADQATPRYLRMQLGEQQERCDWHYLNQNRWLGAFCTMIERLLLPVGVTALCLDTGWFDTVLVFCRTAHVDEITRWFPEVE